MSTRNITDFSLPTYGSIPFRLELRLLNESLKANTATSEAILNLHIFFHQYKNELNQTPALVDYLIEMMLSKELNPLQLDLVTKIKESLKLPHVPHESIPLPENLWEKPPETLLDLTIRQARNLETKARRHTEEAQECSIL